MHRASLLGLPFLCTGAALVVYLVSGVSLLLGIAVVVSLTGAAALLIRRRLPVELRMVVAARVRWGAVAGVAATAAYDACRFVLVRLLDLQFWPFDVFTRFGGLLVGQSTSPAVVMAVGTAYHYANGIGFAVAYALFVRRPGIVTGLLWAGILELFMVSLYPGWLGLQAMNEFLGVSVVGHIVYGLVLGSTTRILLRDDRLMEKRDVQPATN
ncbi:MAG: DUF6789 family protein [Pseudonocardiaceae bacterium]